MVQGTTPGKWIDAWNVGAMAVEVTASPGPAIPAIPDPNVTRMRANMNNDHSNPRKPAPGVRAFGIGVLLATVTFVTGIVVHGITKSWAAPGPNEIGMNQNGALMAGLLLLATTIPLGCISAVFLIHGCIKYITSSGKALECSRCGYSTRGLRSDTCPECGTSLDRNIQPHTPPGH